MSATALIIEDYSAHRALLHSVVSQMGCTSIEAADGRAGIELAASQPPDVIILDLILPDLDGLEVLARLRSLPQTRHVPILIVSAVDDHRRVVEALGAGAEDYVTKPFDAAVLQARIKAMLRTSRLQRSLAENAERAEAVARLARAACSGDLEEVCGQVAAVLTVHDAIRAVRLYLLCDEALVGPYGELRPSLAHHPLGIAARAPVLGRLIAGELGLERCQAADLGSLAEGLPSGPVLALGLGHQGRPAALALLALDGALPDAALRRLESLREPAALTLAASGERHGRRISEGRYRLLFEQAADGLVIVDPRTGICREANHALAHRLGALPSALRGRAFTELFDEATGRAVDGLLAERGADAQTIDGRLVLPGRQARPVQVTLRRVRHGLGTDVVAVIRDADSGGEAAPGLAGREIGRAIRSLNHEINNPLACIVGLSQLLQLRLAGQREHLPHLESIVESAERIAELLGQLRELAVTIGGDAPLESDLGVTSLGLDRAADA